MSNVYQVVEKGSIKCICGGRVILKSTSPNMMIGDSKPLYWKDLLGADIVGCPSSNPCTKVATITNLGTEKNVADSKDSFLLRTDGFKSNKGREIVLINPGQNSSSIPITPTNENIIVDFKKQNLESSQEEEELLTSVKYRLYFLRKSQDLLKPLRPTRGFRNSKEISQLEDELLETYKVYTHTFAYLYISQDNEIKEYKVAYKGEAYNETFLDIYYIDENGLSLNFIPIEKDSEIKISYSNFKLDKNKDKKIIEELNKVTIKPNNIKTDVLKEFYTSNSNDFKFSSLHKDSVYLKEYSKYKPDFINDVNINIFCVIDDILGEIEDRYFELEDSFKNAYTINNSYIAKVQEINNYPITMISILDYFYSTDEEDKLLETLEDKYKELVKIYLSNEDMIKNIFEKDSGKLDWIFEKDIFDTGLAYILKFKQVKYNFFEEFNIEPENGNQFIYYNINKNSFETIKTIKSLNNFSYHTKESKYHTSNSVFLDNSDSKYTLVKNSANELLAGVIFATVYSQKFDELLNENILNIAKELEDILKQLRVKPYLDEARKDNLRKVVDENEIYKDILSFSSKREKDSYLDDYASLDLICRKNSFLQDGRDFKEFFKSKYLYFPEIGLYKEESLIQKLLSFKEDERVRFFKKDKKDKEFRLPQEILDEIYNLLRSKDLKDILNIYKQLEYEIEKDKLDYVLGLKNIVHLLCASRVNIDEEQNINNIFNPKLKHILEFEEHIIKIKEKLENTTVVVSITDYKITQAHSYLLQKSYIFAMLKGAEFKANAQSFNNRYKKDIKLEIDKENRVKLYRFKEVEKIELIQQSYEFIKSVEGITPSVEKLLEEQKDEFKRLQEMDKHQTIIKYQTSLKHFSNVVAVLSIVKFMINEKDKELLDYANFANDTIVLFKAVNSVLKGNVFKVEFDAIKAVIEKVKGKNLFLTILSSVKYDLISFVVLTTLETADYADKRDYTAVNLTLTVAGFSIVGVMFRVFITSPITKVVNIYLAIASVIALITRAILEDSEVTNFLNRIVFSKDGYKYRPYYINEAFKQSNNNEFIIVNNPKELISYLGENYKKHKDIFNIAFKNELQFLYTTLIGLKLEIDDRVEKEGTIFKQTLLKIPIALVEDEKAEFILNSKSYDVRDKEKFEQLNNSDYVLFDLSPHYNKITNTIILNSSIASFKYEFEYLYSYDYDLYNISENPVMNETLTIKNFKQTSFK